MPRKIKEMSEELKLSTKAAFENAADNLRAIALSLTDQVVIKSTDKNKILRVADKVSALFADITSASAVEEASATTEG